MEPRLEQVVADGKSIDNISRKDTFHLTIGMSAVELDEESLVLDALSNRSFKLNETGTFIFGALQQGADLDCIGQRLAERYSLEPGLAESVTIEFLQEMLRRGLIVFRNH
jgi:hypothetical protein